MAVVALPGSTLLVAGGYGVQSALQQGQIARWLEEAGSLAARCASVCTGAFLLAQSGLMTGRKMVTHWRYAELLQRLYPGVEVLHDSLFIRDERFYSSAGVTAGIDLCLSLVEEDHGRDVSLQVAKGLVMYLRRPGGQRQFSAELLAQQVPADGVLQRLLAELRKSLTASWDVESMAACMSMSPRTLHRHCQAELGVTPARLLLHLRLENACQLLEAGEPSLKRVAQLSGFVNAYNLRQAFSRALGVTPGEYRQRFCR